MRKSFLVPSDFFQCAYPQLAIFRSVGFLRPTENLWFKVCWVIQTSLFQLKATQPETILMIFLQILTSGVPPLAGEVGSSHPRFLEPPFPSPVNERPSLRDRHTRWPSESKLFPTPSPQVLQILFLSEEVGLSPFLVSASVQ